jgi:hypothetical protein
MLQPLPALARAQATSTLNFFQEFRRFSNKLVADAAGLKASLQAPPEPITKVQRECNRRRPLLSFWPLPPLALRPAPHARALHFVLIQYRRCWDCGRPGKRRRP